MTSIPLHEVLPVDRCSSLSQQVSELTLSPQAAGVPTPTPCLPPSPHGRELHGSSAAQSSDPYAPVQHIAAQLLVDIIGVRQLPLAAIRNY